MVLLVLKYCSTDEPEPSREVPQSLPQLRCISNISPFFPLFKQVNEGSFSSVKGCDP